MIKFFSFVYFAFSPYSFISLYKINVLLESFRRVVYILAKYLFCTIFSVIRQNEQYEKTSVNPYSPETMVRYA